MGRDWLEPRVMKKCDKCKPCLNECPARAIVPDRLMIHAQRCITFLNEWTDEFPEWVNQTWHNSFAGCMRCRLVRPVNKRLVNLLEQ